MPDTTLPAPIRDERDSVIVVLQSHRPLPAADLGKLLTALARDYKAASRGRTLTVASLRPGSTIIQLMDLAVAMAPILGDAADIAKGVASLADFAKLLFKSLQGKKSGETAPPTLPPEPGNRSAAALIEAAIKSGGEVEVRHRTPDGQTLEISVTPVEAIRVRERERTLRATLQVADSDIPAPSGQVLLSGEQAHEAAESLRRLSSSGVPTYDIKAAVANFVTALSAIGLQHLVETFAVDFENAGEHQLAALLRGALDDGQTGAATT